MLFQFDTEGIIFSSIVPNFSQLNLGANPVGEGGYSQVWPIYIGASSCHFITEPATGTSFLLLQ